MIRVLTHALTFLVLILTFSSACRRTGETIVVGSKNFTEQVILGEIVAGLLEERLGVPVDRRLDLGGTFVCHQALVAGELDVYVEYTGTALSAVLEMPPVAEPLTVYDTVAVEYRRRFDVEWLPPLGFDNTFALVVRAETAARHGLVSISDLERVRGTFRAGFGYEFLERADGYTGLTEAYGFEFADRPKEMDLGLLYRALSGEEVDLVVGNSTDGPIEALGLVVLEDDRRFFPPYDAAPVARSAALSRHEGLREALELLAGTITPERMRRMNHAVDGERRAASDVAREFLRERDLVP